MGTQCRLVVLETSGNQAYIFDTASRRESVGASRLVSSLGRWTESALEQAFEGWTTRDRLADGAPAELVAATAGSATVLLTEPESAKELVTAVTLAALVDAPGLDVCGVVELFTWDRHDDGGALADAVARARLALPSARAGRAEPQARFLRLPVVAPCASTGLPASALYDQLARKARAGDPDPESDPPEARSCVALAKLSAVGGPGGGPGGGAYDQLAGSLWPERGRDDARDGLEAVTDYLERGAEWVAVVHADGNGLGELFRRLPEHVAGAGSDTFAEGMRQLSAAVEDATHDAVRMAVAELPSLVTTTVRRPGAQADGVPAVLPLAMGGDELTVVCDGESALAFAAIYLYAFEAATRQRLAAIRPDVLTGLPDRLTAAAGVAIVKPRYPFFNAYRLAVDLTREAKAVKTFEKGSSALSFHVLYDSGATTLSQVRDRTTFVEPATAVQPRPASSQVAERQLVRLVAQPYVVDGPGSGRALGGVAGSTAWGARHRWSDLLARVDAVRGADVVRGDDSAASGSGALPLSRTQAHDLRTGLFAGRAVADARFDLVRYRYGTETQERLAPGGSLFWTDGAADGALVTGLLDAMDADAFLPRPSASRALDRTGTGHSGGTGHVGTGHGGTPTTVEAGGR